MQFQSRSYSEGERTEFEKQATIAVGSFERELNRRRLTWQRFELGDLLKTVAAGKKP